MKRKSRKSSTRPLKLAGLLTGTAVGGWLLYQSLKPDTVPLPEAIEAQRTSFSAEPAGQLSYYVDKQQPGRPLLLIHSINAAASSFEMKPLFNHYRAARPVYALDLPGYGFSERGEQRPYLPKLYSQAIIDMLETQVGEPADVIVMSLSCEFAARAAVNRPELFTSLTFISPAGFNARPVDLPGESIFPILNFPLWGQPLFELLTVRPSIHYFLQKNFVGAVPEPMVEYAYATAHQPAARIAPLYFLSGQMFSPDIRPAVYEKLTVPTLVIYDQDPNLSFDKLPDVLAANPAWQAERVAPSLGLPHWEILTETTAAIDRFWQNGSN